MVKNFLRLAVSLICFFCGIVFSSSAYANFGIELYGAQWHSQLDTANSMGTSWSLTMNCGPTALGQNSSYMRDYTLMTDTIKALDNWLYDYGLISSINNYNLVKLEGTNSDDLRAAAAYYYGLWNTEYKSIYSMSQNDQLWNIYIQLSYGRPVIVNVKTNMSLTGALHWMSVIGIEDVNNDGDFNDDTDKILVNDPGKGSESDGRKWYTIAELTNYSVVDGKVTRVWNGTIFFYDNYQVGEYYGPYGWHNDEGYSNGGTYLIYSQPSQPFVDCFMNNGGLDFWGIPDGKVYEKMFWNHYSSTYDTLYMQSFSPGRAIVLNKHVYNVVRGYIGVAFPVYDNIYSYWIDKISWYGPAVSNSYIEEINGILYEVQWFEPTENNFVYIAYNIQTGAFNDLQMSLDYGNHLNQAISINTGYSSSGWNMGGGGDEQTPADPVEQDILTSSNYVFDRSTICQDVTRDNNNNFIPPYDPVEERTIFYANQINRVCSWFDFERIIDAVDVRWEFYNADGVLVKSAGESSCVDGYTCLDYRNWDYVTISDTRSFGEWMVKGYINNQRVFTDYFQVLIDMFEPSNVSSQNITHKSAKITWQEYSWADTYKVYQNGSFIGETSNLYFDVNGLLAETEYKFTVKSVRGDVESPHSNEVTVVTLVDPIVEAESCGLSGATEFELATDGLTTGWTDDNSGIIENIFDTERASNVIHLQGINGATCFTLDDNGSYFNVSGSPWVVFNVKTDKYLKMRVKIITTAGDYRHIELSSDKHYVDLGSGYYRYPVGHHVVDSKWHFVAVNIQEILDYFEPGAELAEILKFFVYTDSNVYLDNMMAGTDYDRTVYAYGLNPDLTTTGWITNSTNTSYGAEIIYDTYHGSDVINLVGDNATRFTLRNPDSSDWNVSGKYIAELSFATSTANKIQFDVNVDNAGTTERRFLEYRLADGTDYLSDIYSIHFLGWDYYVNTGWKSIELDLEADLAEFEPDVTLINVTKMYIWKPMKCERISLEARN